MFTPVRIVTPGLFIDEIRKMSVRIIYICVRAAIDKTELRELWLTHHKVTCSDFTEYKVVESYIYTV